MSQGSAGLAGKIEMACDGFCNRALVFKTKILVFASPKLGLESLEDPNLIGSKECLQTRLM